MNRPPVSAASRADERRRNRWRALLTGAGLSGALLTLTGGCPQSATQSVAGEQVFPPSPPLASLAGLTVDCYDVDTGEYFPDCPQRILEDRLVALLTARPDILDTDGDGIPNEVDPDVDGDGQPNGSDHDIDGDGIPNGADPDRDGDGKVGKDDPDEDGDGLADRFDLNDDGDGLFDDEEQSAARDDDGDDDDDEDEDDEDDEDEEPSLDDLFERQRSGNLTDEDRRNIAKEVATRLQAPEARDAVLGALQRLGLRANDNGRSPGGAGPAGINAVDALYEQLAESLRDARAQAGIQPGKPSTDAVLRAATADFVPRAKALDALSRTYEKRSIPGLGSAVSDLKEALGTSDRLLEFANSARRLSDEDTAAGELEDLARTVSGARVLGPAFDTTSGGDLFDAIDLIQGEVDTQEEFEEALRDMVALRDNGSTFEQARDQVLLDLVNDNNAAP